MQVCGWRVRLHPICLLSITLPLIACNGISYACGVNARIAEVASRHVCADTRGAALPCPADPSVLTPANLDHIRRTALQRDSRWGTWAIYITFTKPGVKRGLSKHVRICSMPGIVAATSQDIINAHLVDAILRRRDAYMLEMVARTGLPAPADYRWTLGVADRTRIGACLAEFYGAGADAQQSVGVDDLVVHQARDRSNGRAQARGIAVLGGGSGVAAAVPSSVLAATLQAARQQPSQQQQLAVGPLPAPGPPAPPPPPTPTPPPPASAPSSSQAAVPLAAPATSTATGQQGVQQPRGGSRTNKRLAALINPLARRPPPGRR